MTRRATFTKAELDRASKVADERGKLVLVTRQGILLVDPAMIDLPSPEPERVNTCDEAFGGRS